MVEEAEKNAVADKEKLEQIDVKNQADSLSYQTKKQLEELGSKISSEDKDRITQLEQSLSAAIQNEDYTSMKSLTEELKDAMMDVGQKVYNQGADSAATSSDDVIETDFSTEK